MSHRTEGQPVAAIGRFLRLLGAGGSRTVHGAQPALDGAAAPMEETGTMNQPYTNSDGGRTALRPAADTELFHADRAERPSPAPTSKSDALARVIASLRRSIPELSGIMIASTDGLPVGHDFPDAESEKVAAMAATALGLGKRISERTSLGGFQEQVVRGTDGYLVVYSAGESAVLVLSGPSDSNLGLMRIEARAASAQISGVIG